MDHEPGAGTPGDPAELIEQLQVKRRVCVLTGYDAAADHRIVQQRAVVDDSEAAPQPALLELHERASNSH